MKTSSQSIDDQKRQIAYKEEDIAKAKAAASAADSVDYESALKKANDAVKTAQTAVKDATKTQKSAAETLTEAESAFQTAKTNLDTAKQNATALKDKYTQAQLDQKIAEIQEKLDQAKEAYEDATNASSEGYATLEAYNAAVTEKERALTAAEKTLSVTKEKNDIDNADKERNLEKLQKEVTRLSSTLGDSVVKAKTAGIISSVNCAAGQTVEAQATMAEIELKDNGYAVKLTVTTEQAKRITVGQSASILYYWGETPQATVESVKADPNDPQKSRIVTLNITGDITAGQSFTFSLGEKSANYDTVVPNSAIREDSNGKFVLVVNAKSTPLGNRYTATRMDIQIITSDETNTAVSGLTGGEFVITTSTTPVSAGAQVRLADNT